MGLWAESAYFYTVFKFGARIGGCSMPQPGPFTSKKETSYPSYWTFNGHLGRTVLLFFFL